MGKNYFIIKKSLENVLHILYTRHCVYEVVLPY